MKFSAEGKYLNLQVYIADGRARVPVEALEVSRRWLDAPMLQSGLIHASPDHYWGHVLYRDILASA